MCACVRVCVEGLRVCVCVSVGCVLCLCVCACQRMMCVCDLVCERTRVSVLCMCARERANAPAPTRTSRNTSSSQLLAYVSLCAGDGAVSVGQPCGPQSLAQRPVAEAGRLSRAAQAGPRSRPLCQAQPSFGDMRVSLWHHRPILLFHLASLPGRGFQDLLPEVRGHRAGLRSLPITFGY